MAAGVTRFQDSGAVTLSGNSSILGGDGADTVAFDSALAVTSDAVIAAGAGADSLASLLSLVVPSLVVLASVILPLATTPLNSPVTPQLTKSMGSGTTPVTGSGKLNGTSIYGGVDKDTFVFSKDSLNSACGNWRRH